MKTLFYVGVLSLLLCSACTPQEKPDEASMVGTFAKGADISWLTEQEADGIMFYDENNNASDCVALLMGCGMNAVRLRVWVNHSTGWCNKEDVINKAKRAAKLHQRLMIDFHYSDFFCDPGRQDIPTEWKDYDLTQMGEAIKEHTYDILNELKKNNITPEWVQVGNETTNGMLWPMGRLWDENGDIKQGWQHYIFLSNCGYDAAKQIFPEVKVVVHIDNAWEDRIWWYKKFISNGGRLDIIGLSHYPQTNTQKSWSEMNKLCVLHIDELAQTFNLPVIITEIGTKSSNPTLATQVMTDFIQRVALSDHCEGIFYWEPQVYNGWKPTEYSNLGWGAYDMGAFNSNGQPTDVLKVLFSIQK